jgi:hypothetical protein
MPKPYSRNTACTFASAASSPPRSDAPSSTSSIRMLSCSLTTIPARVGIRQHTSAYVSACSLAASPPYLRAGHTVHSNLRMSAYVSIRQHASAYTCVMSYGPLQPPYVSIRQHTSAYVSIPACMSYAPLQPPYVSIRQHTSSCVSAYLRASHMLHSNLRLLYHKHLPRLE